MQNESISVIKIADVLLVTVPSDLDDLTIQFLQSSVLEAMDRYDVNGLVMDISAVEIMDSFLTRTIVETGHMVKLMGGHTVVSGMRPSVAIATIQLGLSFDGVGSTLDVETAMDMVGNSVADELQGTSNA